MVTRRARGPLRKRWGLLVYIAGDNNLSDAGLEDIEEMCETGASPRVHVGVQIDTIGAHTGSIRYEITEPDWTGRAHRTVIERLPETDTGAPQTLREFLQWGLHRYPAQGPIVVVWGHGAGFRTLRRDVAIDDFGSSLDMPEIEEACKGAGLGPNQRAAILGFDACLMNMLEVVNHLQDIAEIVVGSQQTEPGDGWPYAEVLKAAKTARSRSSLARRIVDAYIQSYKAAGQLDVTQSAVDTAKTEAAVRALSELGQLLTTNLGSFRARVQEARLVAQSFEMADYVDLIDWASNISETIDEPPIHERARDVVAATRAAVLVSRSLGEGVRNAHGLSVWFPADRRLYYDFRAKYLALRFAKKYQGWIRFLDAFHS